VGFVNQAAKDTKSEDIRFITVGGLTEVDLAIKEVSAAEDDGIITSAMMVL
jgi:hypothetical protein